MTTEPDLESIFDEAATATEVRFVERLQFKDRPVARRWRPNAAELEALVNGGQVLIVTKERDVALSGQPLVGVTVEVVEVRMVEDGSV